MYAHPQNQHFHILETSISYTYTIEFAQILLFKKHFLLQDFLLRFG